MLNLRARARAWTVALGVTVPLILAPLPAADAGGGRLVVGVRADVTSFNIYTATNSFSQEIADLVTPRLLVENDDFGQGPPSFAPALASSWEFSGDGLTLTFHLDPAARWSDGTPVTAADVVFSNRAASSPEVGWAGKDVKDFIESVSAAGDRTVVYRFRRAYPYQLMDAVDGNVVPASVYSKIPLAEWPRASFLTAPLASGPFLLKRYERGAFIELARNPAYHRAPLPRLDTVVFRVIPDEQTLINELVTGGIDVMENVPPRAVGRVEASGRTRVIRTPDLSYTFICWNTSRPLFSDPRVRRALTLAIDRQAILEGLLPGAGRIAAGPILSFMWAHDPTVTPLPFDPDAARRLLREAGWEDRDGDGLLDRGGVPFRFELESNQGSGLRGEIVQMVAAQLRRIGVEAAPRVFESGAFIERHEKHEFDAFVGTWRESTKVDLKSIFHGEARTGGYNYGMYADAELDRLIDQARAEKDVRGARDLWGRAQRIIARDQPYTFLFEQDRFHAFPRRLDGPRPGPRSAYVDLPKWAWRPPGGDGTP